MLLNPADLKGNEKFESKFVRVRNDLFITDYNDTDTLHINLARKHKLLDKIEDLKSQNPSEIDGGIIFVDGKRIQIGSSSTSLELPLTQDARDNTLQKIQRRLPDFNVSELV